MGLHTVAYMECVGKGLRSLLVSKSFLRVHNRRGNIGFALATFLSKVPGENKQFHYQERLRDLIGPHSGTYGMGYKAVQPLLVPMAQTTKLRLLSVGPHHSRPSGPSAARKLMRAVEWLVQHHSERSAPMFTTSVSYVYLFHLVHL